MRRLFILLFALSITTIAEAQVLDVLKKIATEAVDNATGGKLTQMAILGSWSYSAPAVRLDSSNTLSNIGGSAISTTLGKKLESAFTKVGITKGFCSITFNEDGSFSMPVKGKSVTGTYTYNCQDHSITMVVGKNGKINLKGYAYISGTELQLVFPINKLTDFLVNIGSSIRSLSTITNMVKQYEDIYLGFGFAK